MDYNILAIDLMKEIVRLNNFDNKIKDLFGLSGMDTVLEISTSNLYDTFLKLSGLDEWQDQVFSVLFYETNDVEKCEKIYKKLMKLKENN